MSEPLSLPDAVCLSGRPGCALLVANKKARRILNEGFERPQPQWSGVENTAGNILTSPEYRAPEIERGPGLCAMLCALHEAGCALMYSCDECDCLHSVDDKAAKTFRHIAISGAEGVMPSHKTMQ